jgi:hypothetical protein
MFKHLTNVSILYGALVSTLANIDNSVHIRENHKYTEFPPMVPLSTVDSVSIFIRNCAMPTIGIISMPIVPMLLLSMYPYKVYCRVFFNCEADVTDITLASTQTQMHMFITKMREPCDRNRDFVCDTVIKLHDTIKKGKV